MGVRGGADQADTSKPLIATDTIAGGAFDGEEMGVTKLATGAAGSATLVSAANGFPVTLDAASLAALESITAIISGAVALDAGTLAALETIGLDAATLAALESITIGTALPAGNNNIGDVDVATLPALPAGTNAIGKLAANSGVDIGDVDVTSVPADPFGANADAVVAAGAVGSISAKLRRISQTLADILALIPTALGAGGGIKVDGSGTALPVSGTVTANAGTGSHVVIGDLAHDAVDTSAGVVKMGGRAVANPSNVSDGDRVNLWLNQMGAVMTTADYIVGESFANALGPAYRNTVAVDTGRPVGAAGFLWNGAAWMYARTPNIFKNRADASITAASPAAGWTPTSGKKVRLMGLSLSLSVAGQIILKDNTTEILRSPQLPAGGIWEPKNLGNGILSAAANNVLNIDVTATGNVGGSIWGTEE